MGLGVATSFFRLIGFSSRGDTCSTGERIDDRRRFFFFEEAFAVAAAASGLEAAATVVVVVMTAASLEKAAVGAGGASRGGGGGGCIASEQDKEQDEEEEEEEEEEEKPSALLLLLLMRRKSEALSVGEAFIGGAAGSGGGMWRLSKAKRWPGTFMGSWFSSLAAQADSAAGEGVSMERDAMEKGDDETRLRCRGGGVGGVFIGERARCHSRSRFTSTSRLPFPPSSSFLQRLRRSW